MSPVTPAHATEAPSIGKTWRQLKSNFPTFATLWGLIFGPSIVVGVLSASIDFIGGDNTSVNFTLVERVLLVPQVILALLVPLASVLMVAVPAIYYATDHCPAPGEIFRILLRNLRRYLLAGLLFIVAVILGTLLFIIPGIWVALSYPLYIHYVFTTELSLTTCLDKALKAMSRNFCGFFVVSLLCDLAMLISVLISEILPFPTLAFPTLIVWPMTQLYLQNYIHYKGMVRA